jgi:hypothetical protein
MRERRKKAAQLERLGSFLGKKKKEKAAGGRRSVGSGNRG